MKIVIMRGAMASGKSTAFRNLKNKKEMKNWAFIDFPEIKRMFQKFNDEDRKKFGKLILISVLKETMKLKKNIILEEVSRSLIQKHLKRYLLKYNYKIIVFEFEVSKEMSYERNVKRRKERGMVPRPRKEMYIAHEKRKLIKDKSPIIVNTNKLSEKKVINFILKNL